MLTHVKCLCRKYPPLMNLSRVFSTALTETHLNTPNSTDKEELFQLMGRRPGSLLLVSDKDEDEGNDRITLEKYNQDWTKHYQGQSSVVVRPKSTKEVSSLLKYCNQRSIPVVPQAGNTGLVGGSVPIHKEVILSVENLNKIEGIDPLTGIIKAQAGCVLQDLHDYAFRHDHLIPVDLGAKGTCQIGGNVSTNAGGSYYYRYGSLHSNVMGLEVVLPCGDILNLGYDPCHLKDNTGYDLKHLFVGAEGTIGVVTKVAMLCPRQPKSKCAAMLACNSFGDVMESLKLAKTCLGETLAAFEFMDAEVLNIVANINPNVLSPIPSSSDISNFPYYILIETHGSNEDHDQEKLEHFLESAMIVNNDSNNNEPVVADGVLAQNLAQIDEMWKLRESCNPSCAASGYVYKYDVSLPIPEFPSFIKQIRDAVIRINATNNNTSSSVPSLSVVNWGHVVDGNLHLNIIDLGSFDVDPVLSNTLESLVLEQVMKRGGSISAEHGLGQYKNKHMSKIKDPPTLTKMRAIKELFDPKGILNPGKYLPNQD